MSLSISLLTLSGTIPVALDNKKNYLRIGKMLNCVVAYFGAISCTRSSMVTLSYPLSLTVSRTCSLTCSRHPASSRSWFSLWRSLSSYEYCGKWLYLVASQSILVPLSRLDHGLVERVLGLSVSHLLPIATAGHRAGTTRNGFSHGSKQYPGRGGTSDVCPAPNEEKNQYVTARGQSICRNP